MIRLEFSATAIEQLQADRWTHPDPRVQRRLHALYLKSQGYAHQEIGQIVNVSAKTLRSFLRKYEADGIEGLKALHYAQPTSALAEHQATIEAELRKRPAKSIKEAAERIERITGVRRSRLQVSRFLKQLGVQRRKVAQVPAQADPVVQDEFLKKTEATHR
jgi:transposase